MENSISNFSMRLPSWDYTHSGAYFLTIGCANRRNIFGRWTQGHLDINSLGDIAVEEWLRTVEIREEIELDIYVIMPNDLHGIVWIWNDEDDKSPNRKVSRPGPASRSLGSFVGGYKASVTRKVREYLGQSKLDVWQHNYYEQIIRNEKHLARVRRYILNNPVKWLEDNYYVGR